MLLSNISDQELVKKYVNGDNKSFEILLNRHKNRVFAFIMSKIKNKDLSEDIFQDTYVKVVNSLQKGKYNEEGKFLPWVMRIAHNLVIDHFRRQKKMQMVRSNNDFNIFDVIKDNKINADEKLIKDQIFNDFNSLLTSCNKVSNVAEKEEAPALVYEDLETASSVVPNICNPPQIPIIFPLLLEYFFIS